MSAEVAVINAVNMFHLCVDRGDWDGARACLSEAVLFSPAPGEQTRLTGDQFIGAIRSNVEPFIATQHLVCGHHVQFDADGAARCNTSIQYHHVSGAGRWVLAGQQEFHLKRVGDDWKITSASLSTLWEEGKPSPRVTPR
jgi:hypothetical protein